MFYNKLRYPLVLVVLLVAGLAFVAAPATAAVVPVLSVPDDVPDVGDDDDPTQGIQVYGIRSETVSFELTVTFQDDSNPPVNTSVDGFDATDIELFAFDANGQPVPNGAVAAPVGFNAAPGVYTTIITAKGNINDVVIRIPAGAAETILTLVQALDPNVSAEASSAADSPLEIEIVRSAAPPLTLSPDKSIGGNAPFTVTLTSTTPITLTEADIKVTDGFIPTNGITSDTAKRVWTCLLYTSPSPRDRTRSRMPSSA